MTKNLQKLPIRLAFDAIHFLQYLEAADLYMRRKLYRFVVQWDVLLTICWGFKRARPAARKREGR